MIRGSVILLALISFSLTGLAQVSVLTAHNDNNRSGGNLEETQLNALDVTVTNFGKLFTLPVDGYIYAQPLYVANVTIGGKQRNAVYVATEHNNVYAFDADDPNAGVLWTVNLGPSVPSTAVCGGTSGCYSDLIPEVGITSTPVLDAVNNLIYLVAKNKDQNATYHYRLHALNITSGAEMLGGPVEITASGFAPLYELNRPGLLLANGNLYIAFGSLGDTHPWHGWIMAYNALTLQQTAVLNTSPSSSGGSIWAGGQGPVADGAGNIYVITANGPFNANTGGNDYSTSFLKLDPSTLSVLDYFTPDNQSYLGSNINDWDLGSGGPLLIPGTSLLLGGGKDGILRLLDTANLGKFNSTFNADVQEWQATAGGLCCPIMNGPVYWNSSKFGPVVYLFGAGDPLKAWAFNGQQFQTTPVSQSTITNAVGYSNMAALSVSADHSTPKTGIIWAASPLQGDANQQTVSGILRAFDANDLTHELWDSQQNAARDSVGNYAKFNPPTIANGKVYLATFSKAVNVYGLFVPPDFSLSASPTSATIKAGRSQTYTVSIAAKNEFLATVSLQCSGGPPGSTCSISPTSVAAGNSATLTITTAATSAAGASLWLPFLLPGLVVVSRRRPLSKRVSALPCVLLLLLVSVACGGGGSSSTGTTPAPVPISATYTINITGQSGSLQHATKVTLTVQ